MLYTLRDGTLLESVHCLSYRSHLFVAIPNAIWDLNSDLELPQIVEERYLITIAVKVKNGMKDRMLFGLKGYW